MWGVAFRQDEVAEVDDTGGLTVKPPVTDGANIILVRHGLKDGYCEDQLSVLPTDHLARDQRVVTWEG